MRHSSPRTPLFAGLFALLVWSSACGAPKTEPDPGTPEALASGVEVQLAPWPKCFQRAALLVADEITIEGPKGLLDHVALGQDDTLLDYTVETLPQGFRQSLTRKKEVGFVEIKAALDALEMTALKRIVVLERPGNVPVKIVANGQVWWRSTDPRGPLSGPAERRGEVLEISSTNP